MRWVSYDWSLLALIAAVIAVTSTLDYLWRRRQIAESRRSSLEQEVQLESDTDEADNRSTKD